MRITKIEETMLIKASIKNNILGVKENLGFRINN